MGINITWKKEQNNIVIVFLSSAIHHPITKTTDW